MKYLITLLLLVVAMPISNAQQRIAQQPPIVASGGEPLVGVYYFTHWWEPWRSSDEAILADLRELRDMGYNTIFLDHEWSQMIDGDWKLLDRGHRLAKQGGMQILPWLSAKAWLDIGTHDYRRELIKEMYGVELTMGVDAEGKPNRTLPYDPAVIEAGERYCIQYMERFAETGALLHVNEDGQRKPVIAPTVELDWDGSCDVQTTQMLRLWLRARYGTIRALNHAWGTSLTGWEQIDACDTRVFDIKAHFEGKATHPAAVEDHVEFRAQVMDIAQGEISRRVRQKYPNAVIASELPYQFDATHPHAIGYRVGQGANPSAAEHADILMIRATDSLTPSEERLLQDYRKRTGQQIIMTYRTYDTWGPKLLSGEMTEEQMVRDYAEQAARVADGFGFYSWNEMVDTHVVPDPEPSFHPTSRITPEQSQAVRKALGKMAQRFLEIKKAEL